ncbi:MAG: oligosaccharide flippase family protein, partial [Elusimicrobiales bacterium]
MVRKIQDFIFINSEFFVYPLIRKIKTQKEYNRLFKNFLSLSVLQAANYIFPLIIFPYLVRVLGVEKFGLISFAQAFIMYFNVLVDYGFNLSATREISINRDNKEKISEIFSSVMFIKFGLIMISLILLTIIVFSFEKFRVDWLIYYLTFGIVIGQAMFPVWLFQGLEEMRYITYVNVIAKGIFTLAVFVFVRNISDYYKVPLLNSIGFITAGIISLVMVKKKFGIIFSKSSLVTIKNQLTNGWHIFVSNIMGMLYRNSNSLLLGIITNNLMVGYY